MGTQPRLQRPPSASSRTVTGFFYRVFFLSIGFGQPAVAAAGRFDFSGIGAVFQKLKKKKKKKKKEKKLEENRKSWLVGAGVWSLEWIHFRFW